MTSKNRLLPCNGSKQVNKTSKQYAFTLEKLCFLSLLVSKTSLLTNKAVKQSYKASKQGCFALLQPYFPHF